MEVIADELEEPLESVQDVCKVASNFAPDYDHVKVIDMWFAKEKMK